MNILKTTEISQKVPREVVITTFGGVLAASPEVFNKILGSMAMEYGVAVDDLSPYVLEVLKSLPCYLD